MNLRSYVFWNFDDFTAHRSGYLAIEKTVVSEGNGEISHVDCAFIFCQYQGVRVPSSSPTR